MQREKFIQKIFDNCEEYIGNEDYLAILEYVNNFIEDKQITRFVEKNFIDIYAELISNIFNKTGVLNLQYKLPTIIWLKCAEISGIKDITIDMAKLDESLINNESIKHTSYNGEMFFNNVDIINLTLHNADKCYGTEIILPEIYVSTLTVEYSGDFDGTPDVLKMFDAKTQKQAVLNIKSSSQLDYLYIPVGFETLVFDPDMKQLPKSVSTYISDVKQLKLPEADNIQIPMWIKRVNQGCTIYKKKGQKISCYKIISEWVKEHLQSI